jgi:hypothetical protein
MEMDVAPYVSSKPAAMVTSILASNAMMATMSMATDVAHADLNHAAMA